MNQNKNQNYTFINHVRTAYRRSLQRCRVIAVRVRHLCTPRRLGLAAAAYVGLTLVVMCAYFYWPRNLDLSFASRSCVEAPTLLPSLTTTQSSKAYTIEPVASLSLGDVALFARTACVAVKAAPQEHAAEQISIAMPGTAMLKKTITVRTGAFPAAIKSLADDKPLSTKDMLKLALDTPDNVFAYTVTANGQQAPCTVHGQALSCDVPALKLAQATSYDLAIIRSVGQQDAGRLLQAQIRTVEPVRVASTSIAAGQLVHDAPTSLTLRLNKPASNPAGIRLENRGVSPAQNLPIDTKIEGDMVTVTFSQPLPRSTALAVVVPALEGLDGAYLETPFELSFTTSGGPKVKGINIGGVKVSPDSTLTLTLDSNVAPGQNLAEFVRIESAAGQVSAPLLSFQMIILAAVLP